MFSKSLLVRSGPLRLSALVKTRVCSRSLSLGHPARCAVPSWTNLRRFSAAPAFRTEKRDDTRIPPAPSGGCYIANVPYQVTAEQLMDAFSEFGKVASVRLLTSDEGLPRGVGFVHFESVADAVNFVEANAADPIFVLDRQLRVEHAKRTNVARPIEPSDTLVVLEFQGESEGEVRSMFGNHAENIFAVRFDKKEADQPLRKAFVQFRNVNMATEAIDAFRDLNETTPIRYTRPRQPPAHSHTLTSRLSQHRGL